MNEDHLPLAGRRAVVTGAGRGIGHAIALALAAAGTDVALCARSHAELEQVAEELRALGRRALALPCDVTNAAAVARMAEEVTAGLGGIDILVNNAGAAASHKFVDHPDELWHYMLAVNLTSVYYVTKAFVPQMVAQRSGRVITIASIAAKIGARYTAAYTASKHGVLGLTRALAAELVGYNITVNAICPSYVDTPMTDGSIANIVKRTGMSEAQARETLEKMSPQARLIAPEEIAALTVYLAQESSRGITGQAINVDGGAVMF
ncbi:MAG TPA: SDR family NAD(P)-dependent oxidoreductase [Roseiflexaceae bacterium]|jgi:NAD(P)-dependent dehydrogenase (short-subunit alcohol dehydrogenase family)